MSVSAVFAGPQVSLPQMLDARERRAAAQARLAAAAPAGASLLCLTLAIPGPVKSSPALAWVFERLREAVEGALAEAEVYERLELGGATGHELLMPVGMVPAELKRRMVALEEEHPLGRLADLDVFDAGAHELRLLSRADFGLPLRRCLICEGEAKACARSRTHTVEAMQDKIASIIYEGGYRDCGNQD